MPLRISIMVLLVIVVSGLILSRHFRWKKGVPCIEMVFLSKSAKTTARYTLLFPQVTGLNDGVQTRINTRIEDEVKWLLTGDYEGDKQRAYKKMSGKSVQDIADSWLERTLLPDSFRFYDSLKVSQSFVLQKILCFRFFNVRNDGGAKDVEFVSFLVFDLETGRQMLKREFIASELSLLEIARPYYEQAVGHRITDESMEISDELGFDTKGLTIEYNTLLYQEQAELVIPWKILKGSMALHEVLLF